MTHIGNGQFWLGDCLDLMRSIPDGSVDMVITSPPYDNMRTYNDSLAWDFESVAQQLTRCLKNGGVIVWNVGDATVNGSETGSSFRQALHFKDVCGLLIHDTMIWKKSNFSNPSKTRYHQTFEYMFILTKGKPEKFNPLLDRPNICAGQIGSRGQNTVTQKDGQKKTRKRKINEDFGMRHNVWEMNTAGQNREDSTWHPAVFPVQLAHDHIVSWSNPNDLVLDPFAGSGTTAVAAERTGRRWICIEKQPEYYYPAVGRVWKELNQ
jgi:site-specific DNA-methyltransferase (adenine-specific)